MIQNHLSNPLDNYFPERIRWDCLMEIEFPFVCHCSSLQIKFCRFSLSFLEDKLQAFYLMRLGVILHGINFREKQC